MYESFTDEFIKIAENERKERIKRMLIDAGVVALGTGAGYGIGSATSRLLTHKYPSLGKSKAMPLILGGLGAGTTLLAHKLREKRKEYVG
jgi:hypothetical protein